MSIEDHLIGGIENHNFYTLTVEYDFDNSEGADWTVILTHQFSDENPGVSYGITVNGKAIQDITDYEVLIEEYDY